jgi:hypothetical protein
VDLEEAPAFFAQGLGGRANLQDEVHGADKSTIN